MFLQPLLVSQTSLFISFLFLSLFCLLYLAVFLLEVLVTGVMLFNVDQQVIQFVIESRLLFSSFFFVLLLYYSLDASVWSFIRIVIVYVGELLQSLQVFPTRIKCIDLFSGRICVTKIRVFFVFFTDLFFCFLFLVKLSEQVPEHLVKVLFPYRREALPCPLFKELLKICFRDVAAIVFVVVVARTFAAENLVSMLVIPGALLLVAEGLSCFLDFLELLSSVNIPVLVRMPLESSFLIGSFDSFCIGLPVHI